MTFTETDLIAYVQELVDELHEHEKQYECDEFTESLIHSIMSCESMIEALTGKSVTVQMNGKVTIG